MKQKRKNSDHPRRRFAWFFGLSVFLAIPAYILGWIFAEDWARSQSVLYGDSPRTWGATAWITVLPTLVTVWGIGVVAILQGILLKWLYHISIFKWLIMSAIAWIAGKIIVVYLFGLLWQQDYLFWEINEYFYSLGQSRGEYVIALSILIPLAITLLLMTITQAVVLRQKFHHSWIWVTAVIPALLFTTMGMIFLMFGAAVGSVIAFPIAMSIISRYEK